jgi:N-methylhydantoinase A
VRISFDIGGTFTDMVLVDDRSGRSWFGKSLTTHDDVSRAIQEGIASLLAGAGQAAAAVDGPVVGATTLMTNALIERRGGPTALVTTRGFKDLIEIGREVRYDLYNLRLDFPPPLVPGDARLEVTERILADGSLYTPLAADELKDIVRRLREQGARSVAVCFLHSYANAEHESVVERELGRALPEIHITTSASVAPEIREVERLNTTVANAYVQPIAGDHFERIEGSIRELGLDHGLHLMQSNGGITDVAQASKFPIRLLESGPAAGALGAAAWGERLGIARLVSFDMGGTTAKICVIDEAQPSMAPAFEIARIQRFKPGSGLTVRVPAVDLLEIGAGGGSIAWIDELGLLKVGPTSAGAEPGPACYGRGGEKPTVTDADLLLGYLDPTQFLGGRMALDVEAAERAIVADVAEAFGSSAFEAAAGIVRVVDEAMALAVRVHATEKGKDPRDYELFAFGGAGPAHACSIARILGMSSVIVPAAAGVLSATGLHVAPPMVSLVQTRLMLVSEWDRDAVETVFDGLARRATAALGSFDSERLVFERAADVRFRGQGFEVEVALPDDVTPEQLVARFRRRYQELYGSLPTTSEPEVVSWRLTALLPGEPQRPLTPRDWPVRSTGDRISSRQAWFEATGWLETVVFHHSDLQPDQVIEGPAIVQQDESTTVIGPADSLRIDEFGHCRIAVGR